MTSQSLYRKWRSQTFGDLVGQEPVIRTLKNALSSGNLAHAYLFTGPRGTGKTSTARLLAKTINCLDPQNGEPCNTCEQCREITIGNSFNVIEIDAASNRGIDSIRELREKVSVPPSTGKYKVYILDEAHMLTVEAFNALLKTLEEPPPHAIFVMATTDVHKMLPTVLSRCQRFDFKRFTTQQLVERLRYVATNEQVTLEPGSAELIARAAAGGMRDALSLLDQAIAYSGTTISLAQVQTMLGVADPRAIQKFIAFIAQGDSPGGLHLIHELTEAGADLRQLNTQIAEYCRAMMLARAGANIADILDLTDDELKEISQAAQAFTLEELTECARIFAQNDLVQKNQATPQLGLELAFLACLSLHTRGVPTHAAPVSHAAPSPTRSTGPVREAGANGPKSGSNNPPDPAYFESPAPAQPIRPSTDSEAHIIVETEVHKGVPQPQKNNGQSLASPPAPVINITPYLKQSESSTANNIQQSVASTPDQHPTLTVQEVREHWEYIKRRVKSKKDGAKIAALLNGYTVESIQGNKDLPVILLRASADFHYKSLQQNESHLQTIEWATKIELKLECKVRLLPPGQALPGIGASYPPSTLPSGSFNVPAQPTSRIVDEDYPPVPEYPSEPEENILPAVTSIQSSPSSTEVKAPVASSGISTPPGGPAAGSTRTTGSHNSPSSSSIPDTLARKALERENTIKTTPARSETRLASAKKQAQSDPVIQEAVRLFRGELKDIQLK